MARRAVVFGSNGPPGAGALQYATRDVERMRAALEGPRCGFEVITPPSSYDPHEIERFLGHVAESCADEDTFVVFFSGHGIVQASGLLLMLDNTDIRNRPLTSALRAESIVHCLRVSKASKKLLILDCCHAGMVYQDSRFKAGETSFQSVVGVGTESNGESFVAIVASDRLEQTREFDELQGSFLTSAICRALGSDFRSADKDRDGAIGLGDVREWLTKVASEHNRSSENYVPIPFMFGRERGHVYLTRAPSEWEVSKVFIDEIPFVVIPYFGGSQEVWAIGQTPVTNAQYKARAGRHPVGKQFDGKGWVAPFAPWADEKFSAPDQPVVCVDLSDARRLARRACTYEAEAVVAPPDVWDFATFGSAYPSYDRATWRVGSIFDKRAGASAPAPVVRDNQVANRFGALDLIGNVWEWTSAGRAEPFESVISLGARYDEDEHVAGLRQELRGGSFLDDMDHARPTIAVSLLQDSYKTRHSDLGFRLATMVPLETLEPRIREQVEQHREVARPARPASLVSRLLGRRHKK
jgi:hypothetical protein